MSNPIWPVVTENLAEQLSAAQSGVVHPVQLLPYLPVSLRLIEQTLNELAASDRVERSQQFGGLTIYIFRESVDRSPTKFAPTRCVYSNEELDGHSYSALSPEVRSKVEAELGLLAEKNIWPADAVWEHELLYLANNLPAPVSTSDIAGHSRISFKKVELHLADLKARGAISQQSKLNSWELPPLRYPEPAYKRNDTYIRKFPGAMKEEFEVRLVKGLSIALGILLASLILAVSARLPFPIVFFGGLIVAFIIFIKILKAPPKPLPKL